MSLFSNFFQERRGILNKLLFAIVAMILFFTVGFIAGGISQVSGTLVEPYHFSWTQYCANEGGDPSMCYCVEKEMVKIYGSRDPKESDRYSDPAVPGEAIHKCMK